MDLAQVLCLQAPLKLYIPTNRVAGEALHPLPCTPHPLVSMVRGSTSVHGGVQLQRGIWAMFTLRFTSTNRFVGGRAAPSPLHPAPTTEDPRHGSCTSALLLPDDDSLIFSLYTLVRIGGGKDRLRHGSCRGSKTWILHKCFAFRLH